MKTKILFLLFFLFGSVFGQRYFLPVPIESSNGRPIQNADVDLYQNDVKVEDCIWLNAGRYYYEDTTVVTPGAYDIYVDGISWQTNTYINYGASISVQLDAAIGDTIGFANDTTELKLKELGEGKTVYLKQLASGNTNGGGWFVAKDSANAEDTWNYFDHSTTGLAWQRDIRHYDVNIAHDTDTELYEVLSDTNVTDDVKYISFEPGNYSYDSSRLEIYNANSIVIDMNGSVLDLNYTQWVISTEYSSVGKSESFSFAVNGGFHSDGNYGNPLLTGSDFSSQIVADSNWFSVDDLSDWYSGMAEGDVFSFEDSSNGAGAGDRPQFVAILDRIDSTNSRLYFKDKFPWSIDTTFMQLGGESILHSPAGGKSIIVKNGTIKNGNLLITGFENVQMFNMKFFCEDHVQFQAANINGAGITLLMCSNIQANNIVSDGFSIQALGYGFSVGRSNFIQVTNLITRNCRHAFTANSTNFATIVNGSAVVTDSARAYIGETVAWDTHNGCLLTRFVNCYTENYDYAFKLRGEEMEILDCRSKRTTNFVKVTDIGSVRDGSQDPDGKGRRLVVRNSESLDTNYGFKIESYSHLNYFEITNSIFKAGEQATMVLIRMDGDTSMIDTLLWSGGRFEGSATSIGIHNPNSAGSDGLKYFKMTGVDFDGFSKFIACGKPFIREAKITSNFSNSSGPTTGWYYYTTEDTTDSVFDHFEVSGSTFKNITNIIQTDSASQSPAIRRLRLGNWYWNNNIFKNVDGFKTADSSYIDTIYVINNTFIDCGSAASFFNWNTPYGTAPLIIHENNKYYGTTGDRTIIRVAGDADTTPHLRMINETVLNSSNADEMFYFNYAKVDVLDCNIEVTSSVKTQLFQIYNSSTVKFIDNYIEWNADTTAVGLIYDGTNDNTFYINGNTFLLSGDASHVILHSDSSTFYVGKNTYQTTDSALDTADIGASTSGSWANFSEFGGP